MKNFDKKWFKISICLFIVGIVLVATAIIYPIMIMKYIDTTVND